jgi:hypothetical protein
MIFCRLRDAHPLLQRALPWFALAIVSTSTVAQAADCTFSRDIDTIQAGIEQAPSCAKAASIAKDCAFGASGDVPLAAAVTKVCEKDFFAGLSGSMRKSYKRQTDACAAKYAHESGSMYRSFEAFCRSGVAEHFSQTARGKHR